MTKNFSHDYKRGYLNGYQEAFENILALLKLDDYDLEQVKQTCRAFWTEELAEWVENGGDRPALHIPSEPTEVVTSTHESDAAPEDPYEGKTP